MMLNQNLKPTRYIVKQNDNLDLIARNHGYKSWQIIYHSNFNSELRTRCPNPDKIFDGVNVFLPPKSKDVILALNRSNSMLQQIKQDFINTTDKEISNLKQSLNKIKSTGAQLDAAKDAITILVDLSSIIKMGAKALKLNGKLLEEMNKKIAEKTFEDLARNPIFEKGLEVYSEADLDNNIVTVTSQIIVGSYISMISPSFWANTISNLYNGMSWSQAVTSKPDDVYTKCVQDILNQRNKINSDIDRRINENNKLIIEFSNSVEKPLPIKMLF
jgi:hypothetical protein